MKRRGTYQTTIYIHGCRSTEGRSALERAYGSLWRSLNNQGQFALKIPTRTLIYAMTLKRIAIVKKRRPTLQSIYKSANKHISLYVKDRILCTIPKCSQLRKMFLVSPSRRILEVEEHCSQVGDMASSRCPQEKQRAQAQGRPHREKARWRREYEGAKEAVWLMSLRFLWVGVVVRLPWKPSSQSPRSLVSSNFNNKLV